MSLRAKIAVIILVTMTGLGFYAIYNINDTFVNVVIGVFDKKMTPIDSTLVIVTDINDDKNIFKAVTHRNGLVNFHNIRKGEYRLTVSTLDLRICGSNISLDKHVMNIKVTISELCDFSSN